MCWYVDGNWPEKMMACVCVLWKLYVHLFLLQEHGMTIWKLLWDDKTCLLHPYFHSVHTTGWTGFIGRHGVFTFSNVDFFKYIIRNIILSRHGQLGWWLVGFHAEVARLDGLRREVSWLVVICREVKLLLGVETSQCCVYVLFLFQGVPLSDRAAWVGQHVGPVLQLCAWGLAADKELSNGIIFTNLVIVEDGDHHQDFLGRKAVTELQLI